MTHEIVEQRQLLCRVVQRVQLLQARPRVAARFRGCIDVVEQPAERGLGLISGQLIGLGDEVIDERCERGGGRRKRSQLRQQVEAVGCTQRRSRRGDVLG